MTHDTPAPRLDPNCQCICHTQPGVMHIAACCQPLDQGSGSMTHDTPPKRICPDCGSHRYARCDERIEDGLFSPGSILRCVECKTTYLDPVLTTSPEFKRTLTSEVEAMVAAALREASDARQWQHYPIPMPVTADGKGPATIGEDAASVTYEVWDEILQSHASFDNLADAINEAMRLNSLIPQPASAALDKLIAEAVAAATPTMQRAARVLHDEAMAAAYLGENVTEDEAAMLQFIDALGGKTKVINALHALATATKGATP